MLSTTYVSEMHVKILSIPIEQKQKIVYSFETYYCVKNICANGEQLIAVGARINVIL
jgi:hypothetical protein